MEESNCLNELYKANANIKFSLLQLVKNFQLNRFNQIRLIIYKPLRYRFFVFRCSKVFAPSLVSK